MRSRAKGQQFPAQDLEAFLIAFGDDDRPLPETVKILDEIVTDYIIETCHEAAAIAHHARRAKIKLDDFKFMLRRDTAKLGRVSEMLDKEKELKRQRKAFDTDEGAVAKDADKDGAAPGGDKGDDGNNNDDGGAGGKASTKARSEAGSKRGMDADAEERRKKKRKKNKEKGGDAASVASP